MLVLAITNTAKVSAVRIDSVTLRTLLFVQAGAFFDAHFFVIEFCNFSDYLSASVKWLLRIVAVFHNIRIFPLLSSPIKLCLFIRVRINRVTRLKLLLFILLCDAIMENIK